MKDYSYLILHLRPYCEVEKILERW